MRVCTGPYLPEPGVGATEWNTLERKTHTNGHIRAIKSGYAGSLKIWLGSRYGRIGEDGHIWVGKDMGKSDWEGLVKNNLYIPV